MFAIGNVTHNLSPVPCSHPYTIALQTYINRAREPSYQAVVRRCGTRKIARPFCETRVVKTALDLVLCTVFLVCVAFKVQPLLF